MKRIVMLLCCLTLISLYAQAGQLYRWVDDTGRVYYGDVPPAGVTDVEILKYSDESVPSGYIPYESRKAQQNFPVVLYVGTGCSETCIQARNLLNKRGIPFIEKVLSSKEDADEFKRLSGGEVVPTLAVGKTFLKGFQPEPWQAELDVAGYPKTAPYRAPTAADKPAAAEKPAAP